MYAHCDVLKCDCDLIMYRGVEAALNDGTGGLKAVFNDVQGQFDYVKGGKSSNLIMDRRGLTTTCTFMSRGVNHRIP